MQGTAGLHDQIADPCLSQAAGVMDDAAALDATVDVFDAHTSAGDAPIGRFLRVREGPAPWLPRRHDDLDLSQRERQEAEILKQPAARGQGIRGGVCNPLLVGATRIGLTQEKDRERGIDEQDVFHRVACFLAAITARLLSRILGALEASFGAVVANRGEAGAGAGAAAGGSAGGGGAGVGTAIALTSAAATPRRCANSVTDRVGASPSARSVARSTTKRT
jgi:hypothetical protein